MALCNAASVTTKSAVSMINFITNKSKWADCRTHYETELIFCVLDGQLTMTLPFSWTPQPVTQWTKKRCHSILSTFPKSAYKDFFFNATGWSQLAPLWPGCHVMCRLHEPKCSHVLRLFLALTCMVHGCGGSSSPWRGLPSWCFSSQHFNSGDFHWRALDVGCHARKWHTERKQALSKESNSFLFYFNLSNSLLLV